MSENGKLSLKNNPPMHKWVSEQGYLLARTFLPEAAGAEMGGHLSSILEGSAHEDEEALEGDLVVPLYGPMPFISHYWDPDRPGKRFAGCGETCIERMRRRWGMMLGFYSKGMLPEAYEQFGHVAHLLEDMSVPAHVHWDLHPIYDTYEMGYLAEKDHELPGGYNFQQWKAEDSTPAAASTLEGLFESLARVAQQFDSNDAAGKSPAHSLGHSGRREFQPLSSRLFVWYDVSYADAGDHATVCMPAAIGHVARLYGMFWTEVGGRGR